VLDLESLLDVQVSGIAVLYIDLDNFKAVNDAAKEHEAGDKCIAQAAAIIGSVARHKGRVYRLHVHGDEFAVILPNCDESEARAAADRIRSAIERQKPGGDIPVTASIGVFITTGQVTAEEALNRAAKAMFVAKNSKNTIHFG
jgi:diguanylate cyclase (GGDEF)-like protein